MNGAMASPRVEMFRCAIPAAVLLVLLIGLPHSAPVFHALFPQLGRPLYTRTGFVLLTLIHASLTLVASAIAVALALALGIAVTRPGGRPLLATVRTVAVIGQTLPPVAVLAIAVPLLGFGAPPTLLALALYGVLPVLGQTIAGLLQVPTDIREAADGMGYSHWRCLREVELPLALGPIMAGVRVSAIVGVGTAALGSTVGAATLGAPIIEGLVGNNTAYVIQGVLLVGSLALLIDALLGLTESWLRRASSRTGLSAAEHMPPGDTSA